MTATRLLCIVLLTLVASPLLADPTDEEIAQAVADLGSPRFPARQKASKFLWEAGRKAEPALADALKGENREAARRAAEILEKFRWGIYPDTPPEIVDLIGKYRAGDRAAKAAAASDLIAKGKAGYFALKKLAFLEENAEDRAALVQQMTRDAQKTAAGLLVENDLDAAEDLLEACLAGQGEQALADYAAFVTLRGKLPAAIKRFETELAVQRAAAPPADDKKPAPINPSSPAARAAEVLAHLYRARGDFNAARKAAEQTGRDELVDAVLWEAGDWKALAGRPAAANRARGNPQGVRAAYQRLGGDSDGLKKTLDDVRDQLRADAGGREDLRGLAEALALNGFPVDAVDGLAGRKSALSMAFEMLATRHKYKEAFALADGLGKDDEDVIERRHFEVRRARLLYLLGDRDAGLQLFDTQAKDLKEPADATHAYELFKAMSRLGLKDAVADHTAEYLHLLKVAGAEDSAERIAEPIFGKEKAPSAVVWWRSLRRTSPDDTPATTMKRVRVLLEGTKEAPAGKQAVADIAALAKEAATFADDNVQRVRVDAAWVALADAAKKHAPDDVTKYLRKATDAAEDYRPWVRLGDHHMDRKEYKEAAAAYRAGWDKDNKEALPLFLHGLALQKAGEMKEGRRLADLAHWLPLGDEAMRSQLHEELQRRNLADAARREQQLILTVGWYRYWYVGNVLNHAARDAIARKEFGKAADHYDRAIVGCLKSGARFADDSAYVIVPGMVAHLRARQAVVDGKFDDAMKLTDGLLAVMPGHIELATHLVPALEKAGRGKDADALYKRVADEYVALLKEYPDSPMLHNSVAWLGATTRRDIDKAVAHARKAVEMSPKSAGYLDTLAEALFQQGKAEEAVATMKRCREMEPENEYFRRQLARFEKGDRSEEVPEGED